MSDVKLSYFNFNGGRGEDCRLALHIAGVDFEDDRINGPDWAAKKGDAPYGAMPILTINGKQLAQSNAVLGFIGRHHDLLPSDPWEAARHVAALNYGEELRTTLNPKLREKDPEKKKAIREEFAAGWLQGWARNLEAEMGDGPFFGDAISVADLKLFVLLKWFIGGGVDHIPGSVFDDFPKLRGLYEAVNDHPKVVDWYAKRG